MSTGLLGFDFPQPDRPGQTRMVRISRDPLCASPGADNRGRCRAVSWGRWAWPDRAVRGARFRPGRGLGGHRRTPGPGLRAISHVGHERRVIGPAGRPGAMGEHIPSSGGPSEPPGVHRRDARRRGHGLAAFRRRPAASEIGLQLRAGGGAGRPAAAGCIQMICSLRSIRLKLVTKTAGEAPPNKIVRLTACRLLI